MFNMYIVWIPRKREKATIANEDKIAKTIGKKKERDSLTNV